MNREKKKIENLLKGVVHPVRLKIALLIFQKENLSFTEIRNELKAYEKDVIYVNLKTLEKSGVIICRKVKKNSKSVGKPQVTLCRLTKEGKVLLKYLKKAIEEIDYYH